MPRSARIVVPGLPHHVTQRGNRRGPVFFEPGDYARYKKILAESCRRSGVGCWAYCLMPNHVHLVLTPSSSEGLARAIGEAHRQFTSFINARAGWTGHLFQGRFSSVVMDEDHLLTAVRYVCLNPVRAKLVSNALDWPWSSTRAHIAGISDGLVDIGPLRDRVAQFADILAHGIGEATPEEFAALRAAEFSGRPLGGGAFLDGIALATGRSPRSMKLGRKPRLQS